MGITLTKNNMTPSIKRITSQLRDLPQKAYNEFVKNTPKRSGNARRKTKLRNNEIVADYPYAQKLDEGYSDQAPTGMTKPTENYVRKELKKIMRK